MMSMRPLKVSGISS